MTTTRLAGRDRELQMIARTLDTSATDRVLLLVGDPGIGKSALLSAADAQARESGALILRTVGVEAEAQIPFAGLQQLLADTIEDAYELPATHRDALLSAFGMVDTGRPELFLIAEAVSALLAHTARSRPVVIIADDLQWIDTQSNDVLAFVARRAGQLGIAVVGAVRTGYSGTYLSAAEQVVLTGLDAESADRLLAAHAPHLSAVERERVHEEAMGNPLALLELPGADLRPLGTAADGGAHTLSARLEHAFAARTDVLPAAARDVVLIAATDYSGELDEILEAASVLHGAPITADDVTAAQQLDILRIDDQTVIFRHPLVRSGVLQHETLARRHSANAALARVVSDDYRRVWHRAQSIVGPDDAIADELEEAAAESVRRGAVLAAIRSLERSAQLTSLSVRRGHRLLVAAEHAFDLGRADVVDDLLASARRTDLSELDRARMAWLREIFNDGTPGDATRVQELCDIARRSAEAGEIDLALNLLLGAAMRCWWADTGPAARAHVVTVAHSLDVGADPRLLAVLAVAEPVLQAATVSGLLDRIHPLDAEMPDSDATSLRLCGMAAHAIGDSPRASRLLDAAATQLREQGRLGVLTQVLSMLVIIRLELGNLRGAVDAVDEGLRLAEDTGQPIWTTGTLVCAARAEAMQGHRSRALDLASQAELAANRQRLNDLLACVQMARGLAHLDAERYEVAYDCFRTMFDPASGSFHQRERFDAVMFLAETAVYTGNRDEARLIVDELETVANITPAPLLHAHLHLARAILADDDTAEDWYRTGLAADLGAFAWVRGRLEQAYGAWLMQEDRTDQAIQHFDAARAIYLETGAAGWVRLVDAELARTGRAAP